MAEGDRERWDQRHAGGPRAPEAPPDWLDSLDAELPREGRALDVAAGSGRVALWLAARGLELLAVDVSPVGLERGRRAAAAAALALETLAADLETTPLPPGPFALVACFHYFQRDLFPAMRERLLPGGVLVCELSTRLNLTRHAHPSARWLVETNELLALAAPLEIACYREGWIGDRALARVVGRRPAAGRRGL